MPYTKITASASIRSKGCFLKGVIFQGTSASSSIILYESSTTAAETEREFMKIGNGTSMVTYSPSEMLGLTKGLYAVINQGTAYVHYG